MAVQGNLKDISLSSLISVNCNEMNRARLTIKGDGKEASIYFEGGNIVHASMDALEGEDVLYKLLRWEEGEFNLEQEVSAPRHTVKQAWSGILLEGMRRIDEWNVDLDLDFEESGDEGEVNWEGPVRQIHRDVSRIAGVAKVRITDIEGNIFPKLEQDAEKRELTTAAFIFQRGKSIAELLGQGVVESILYTQEIGRRLIFHHEGGFLTAELSDRASVENVIEGYRKIRARYQL